MLLLKTRQIHQGDLVLWMNLWPLGFVGWSTLPSHVRKRLTWRTPDSDVLVVGIDAVGSLAAEAMTMLTHAIANGLEEVPDVVIVRLDPCLRSPALVNHEVKDNIEAEDLADRCSVRHGVVHMCLKRVCLWGVCLLSPLEGIGHNVDSFEQSAACNHSTVSCKAVD